MPRVHNGAWSTTTRDNCYLDPIAYQRMSLEVLMDIRAELQTLNAVFRCPNALAIPDLLRAIKKNTTKRKYVRKVSKP